MTSTHGSYRSGNGTVACPDTTGRARRRVDDTALAATAAADRMNVRRETPTHRSCRRPREYVVISDAPTGRPRRKEDASAPRGEVRPAGYSGIASCHATVLLV